MQVRSIQVENFGTIEALQLRLDGGLTVICGPNESGKTTLGRAMWFALTRRATSQAEEIRQIEPHSGGTPSVELVVELEGKTYTLAKTFAGQSGSTTLKVDEEGFIDTYNGEEADEVLREALGFGEASGRRGIPDHHGFWPVTWVRQGESGSDPGEKLTEHGDEASVSEVLAELGGNVLAGAGAGDLLEKAHEEYERFFTSGGNKTTRSGAPLHEAEQRLEEAEEQLDRLDEKQKEYEQDLEEYGRLKDEIEELEDEEIPKFREEAEAAREEFERVEELRGTLKTKEAELDAAETRLGRAGDRLERRNELRDEIETLEGKTEEFENEASRAQNELEAHQERRAELVESKEEAEGDRNEIEERVDLLEAHLEVLRLDEELSGLTERLDTVQGHEEGLDDVKENLAGLHVTDEAIEELEQLKEASDRAAVELETAAAQVRLTAHSDVELTANGDRIFLSSGEEDDFLVDEPTTFSIDQRLDLEIEPGGEDLADIRSRTDDAQQAYAEALSEHGVDSLAEARTQKRKKENLSGEKDRLESLIDQATPSGGREALEDEKREVNAALEEAREDRQKLAEKKTLGDLPDEISAIDEELEEARGELETAEEDLAAAKEALNEHDRETSELREQKNLARRDLENKREELENAQEQLESHIKEYGPDEELEDRVAEAETERDRLKEDVENLKSELDELNPDQVEQEKKRAEDALETAQKELRENENARNELRGRLTSSDLRGLHGRLQEAREDVESAEAEVHRWERKAQAAKLLYETLSECRTEAKKEHLAPLRREVETLLGRFFADEQPRIEFAEDFGVSRLSRAAEGSFEFDQLSAGAREQLGLLVRLAMARLVAQERPHPVFLDEPLADTDPDRFDRIARVLREMADELQILVTTCHRDRYRRLGVQTVDLQRKKREAVTD